MVNREDEGRGGEDGGGMGRKRRRAGMGEDTLVLALLGQKGARWVDGWMGGGLVLS